MSVDELGREYRVLSLDAIDPPELDARIGRDPAKLEELSRDIARRGLLLPLLVAAVNGRYELVDGFRRFQACRMAGKVAAPCLIYPTKEAALQGAKYAANAYREEMSPAEEAMFFAALFEGECEHDLDRVCAMVGKSRNYVDNKLALLTGFADIFDAVRERSIPLGVAHALNKITDDGHRHYFLTHAIKSGATVAVVENWVRDWLVNFGGERRPEPAPAPSAAVQVSEAYDPHRCFVCRQNDPRFIPELLPIHTHCRLANLEPLLKALAEGRVHILQPSDV